MPDDPGLRRAKVMLREAAADPAAGDWRIGYIAACVAILRDGYGIEATYVPATYTFDDETTQPETA